VLESPKDMVNSSHKKQFMKIDTSKHAIMSNKFSNGKNTPGSASANRLNELDNKIALL
jgi:hypothetical protein